MFFNDDANKLKKIINGKFEQGDLEGIEVLIKEYSALYPYDIDSYCMRSILYYCEGRYDEAEQEIEKIINKAQFNFDLNYNLALISFAKGDYEKSLTYYCKSCYLSNSEELSESIMKIIDSFTNNKLIESNKIVSIIKSQRNIFELTYTGFPKKVENETYLGNMIFNKNEKEGYFVALYDYYMAQRDKIELEKVNGLNHFYKIECLFSKKIKNEKLEINEKQIIPICVKEPESDAVISVNGQTFDLSKNMLNRFYYYPIDSGIFEISSKKEIILGNPIIVKNDLNKKKLVLNIFVDGLSQKFLEEKGIENLMPNTYSYFKEGTICNNVHVTGEWTYVNMASFFTGEYMTNHGMFHPTFNATISDKKPILSELFKEDGYFTAKIDGDWRSVPTYGYIRGVDRFLYQPAVRGMNAEEVITETIEHIEAFKDLNKFLWICLSDLHDIPDEFEGRLVTQVNDDISNRVFNSSDGTTSVRKGFDKKKIGRYENQIKRLDIYLGILFNYLEKNFKDEEILISLISDHGQGFLIPEGKAFLSEERSKVPFMFRGKNISKGICDELIEGIDLLPILLRESDVNYEDNRDSNLPKYFGGAKEREYTYTESIFPGSTYKVAINDKKHEFVFETEGIVGQDGRFTVGDYKCTLLNKSNGREESKEYSDKIKDFLMIIFDHIKQNIIF